MERDCCNSTAGKQVADSDSSYEWETASDDEVAVLLSGPLTNISSALGDGKAQVCCQGTVQLDQPPVIFGEDAHGALFAVHLPLKDAGCSHEGVALEALQPLLDACEPAKFGRGSEEVLDDSVRQALTLPMERCATSFSVAAHSILGDVHELLMPDALRISARLHKLNVYAPGGFFKTHKDTPRSQDFFGSLVVCLPVPHTGGALVIRHKDVEQARCQWGAEADTHEQTTIRWAAFYSDCDHEIEPVTSGHRITLTYELTASVSSSSSPVENGGRLRVAESTASGSSIFAALKAALEDPSFLPEGGILGIACGHEYVTTAGGKLKPEMLKGGDALVYAVASKLQLDPALNFVVKDGHRQYHCWYGSDSDESDADNEVMVMDAQSGHIDGDIFLSDLPWTEAFERTGFAVASDVIWLNKKVLRFRTPHACSMFMGNEPETSYFYSAAALLLKVPPSDQR